MKCEKHEALFLEAKSRLINNLPTKMMLQSCNNFPARLANSLYKTLGLLSLFLRKETKAVTLAFGRDTIFQSKSCLRLRVTQRGSGRETQPCVVESLRWSAKAKDLFGKEFGGKPKNINVGESHILTTIAVGGAPAEDTLIRSSLMRPKLSLKNLNNHPGKFCHMLEKKGTLEGSRSIKQYQPAMLHFHMTTHWFGYNCLVCKMARTMETKFGRKSFQGADLCDLESLYELIL